MNFKKNGGFTLVELIVVIAILGILAGIGIPQYSKYVEKAQIAVDNQNLNMLHNVFVVSCVENSVDPADVTLSTTNLKWNPGTKTFTGLQNAIQRRDGSEDPIVKSFNGYIGSEGIQFKSDEITEAVLVDGIQNGVETGGSKPTGSGTAQKFNYGDGTMGQLTFMSGDISNFKNSTFGTSMTVDELMAKVDLATEIAEGLIDGNSTVMTTLMNSDAFKKAAADALGLDSVDDLPGALTNLSASSGTDIEEIKANAAVLFAAQSTTGMTADQVVTLLGDGKVGSAITDNLKTGGDASTAMANSALAYGMYTAYANSVGKGVEGTADTSNPSAVIDALDDKAFLDYINSPQGKTDAQAYLSALNMINSSVDNTDAVEHLVTNGFTNSDLTGTLNAALGNTTSND